VQVPQSDFDPELVSLMGRVCEEAWQELRSRVFFPTPDDNERFRHQLATRVMAAVARGERDPQRLKAIALTGLDG
jgi:hypothetical protein